MPLALARIEALYARHPVRKETILARLRRDRRPLGRLTERDLAEDPSGMVTDQNHVGGWRSAEALGRAAGVTRRSRVADLGCGVGGTARVLAQTFGCRVDGYDVSTNRIRDARDLTRLVGLTHLVSFRRADILRVRVPVRVYDAILGQAAWAHVKEKQLLLTRWRGALRPGGRVAIEDACILRSPITRAERVLLARLESAWAATLVRSTTWVDLCRTAGLDLISEVDLSDALPAYYRGLLDSAARVPSRIPAGERQSWRDAVAASHTGLIGLFRIVATATPRRRGAGAG